MATNTAGASGGGAANAAGSAGPLTSVVPASQLAEEYVKLLDAVGTPNYETIQSLFAGYGCPPANTIPAIQVSFELFEAVQNRFAATKQVLERTKADLLNRNQQYTILHQDMHRLQDEYDVLQKRNSEAEERNTELHQQRAKLEVSVEQLRREVGQGRTALDALRNKLSRREEELQMSQSRVAENLVALSQKDAVVSTLRRELMKKGQHPYGAGRAADDRRSVADSAAGDNGDAADGEGGRAAGSVEEDENGDPVQAAYTADMLENIAADVEGRAQEARMKLNVADLENRLARLQEEKDSVLAQHTQYRQHVQLALQSYEAEALLREDAMGGHVCLRTPYFTGEQQELFEKVVDLQTGETLPGADGDGATTLPNFTALTFELRRIVDRFAKVRIDNDSRLHDDLALCVDAQRHALQAGADLVGFLSTMEEEVLRRRLTLPEVREEWKKARVPVFAHAIAAALRESTSELNRGLVGLLEQENVFVAEIEAARATRQPAPGASSSAAGANAQRGNTAELSVSAATQPDANDSVSTKTQKASPQGDTAAHVDVGVMARPQVSSQDVAVQVVPSDLPGVDSAETGGSVTAGGSEGSSVNAAQPAAPSPSLPISASAVNNAAAETAKEAAKTAATMPSVTTTPTATISGAEKTKKKSDKTNSVSASSVVGGKANPPATSSSDINDDKKKRKKSEVDNKNVSSSNKNNNSNNASLPVTAQTSAQLRNSPDADPRTALRENTDPAQCDEESSSHTNAPAAAPVSLTGVCPHCAHAVTLPNEFTGQPPQMPAVLPAGDAQADNPHASLHSPASLAQPETSAFAPSLPVSLSASNAVSAVSQPGVALPSVYATPTDDPVAGAAADSVRTSQGHVASSTRSEPVASAGATAHADEPHESAVENDNTNDNSLAGGGAAHPHSSAAPSLSVEAQRDAIQSAAIATAAAAAAQQQAASLAAQLSQYQHRLTSTEGTLAGVQAENAELRAQLKAALDAAAAAAATGHPSSSLAAAAGAAQEPNSTPAKAWVSIGKEEASGAAVLVDDDKTGRRPGGGAGASTIGHPESNVRNADGSSVTSAAAVNNARPHSSSIHSTAAAMGGGGGGDNADGSRASVNSSAHHVPADAGSNTTHESSLAPLPAAQRSSSDPAGWTAAAEGNSISSNRHTPSPPLTKPSTASSQVQSPAESTMLNPATASTTTPVAAAAVPSDSANVTAAADPHSTAAPSTSPSQPSGPVKGSRPTASSTTTATAAPGGLRRPHQPAPPTHFFSPTTAGYPGGALVHGGPTPAFTLDLVITGSRNQQSSVVPSSSLASSSTTTTRWAAADRSHMSVGGPGASSSNSSPLTHPNNSSVAATHAASTSTSKTSTPAQRRVASTHKLGKRAGQRAGDAAKPGPQPNFPRLGRTVPVPSQNSLRAATPPLPPVKAPPPTTRGERVASADAAPPLPLPYPIPTSHLSSPVPLRPALPAIHAAASAAQTGIDDTPGDEAAVKVGADGGEEEVTADAPLEGATATSAAGVAGVDGAHNALVSGSAATSCIFSPTPPPSTPPPLQASDAHSPSAAVVAPVLTRRQEVELVYQVLRLRASANAPRRRSRPWLRGGRVDSTVGIAGTAVFAHPNRNVGVLGGGGGAAATAAAGAVGGRRSVYEPQFASMWPVTSPVPGGCVRRPLVIRRVRQVSRHGSRRSIHGIRAGQDGTPPMAMRGGDGALSSPSQARAADVSYRYYFSSPAEVPRHWSTGRHSSLTFFGGRKRVSRTWQQQLRYEQGLRQRQASPGPLNINGHAVRSGATAATKTTEAPRRIHPAHTFPPFTREHLAKLARTEKPLPPFFASPFLFSAAYAAPTTTAAATAAGVALAGGLAGNGNRPLQLVASHMPMHQRLARRPTRVALLRAKRDPVRRAVKRNVYTAAANPGLPSYHAL